MKQNPPLHERRAILALSRLNMVYFIAFLIALAIFLIYSPALRNDFVNWDDSEYVYENPNIRSLGSGFFKWVFSAVVSSNWHPLTMLSYALDYFFWGLNPFGYHLTNIVLHSLNTFLVFILAYRLVEAGGGPTSYVSRLTIHDSRFTLHLSPLFSSGSIPFM